MRRLPYVAFVLVLLSSALESTVRADTPSQPPMAYDLKAIDDYVAGQVQEKGYVGLSLAIVRDGKVVLEKTYGKRSLAPAAVVDTETPFAIGSVTKQFIAACILMLA